MSCKLLAQVPHKIASAAALQEHATRHQSVATATRRVADDAQPFGDNCLTNDMAGAGHALNLPFCTLQKMLRSNGGLNAFVSVFHTTMR